MYCNYYFFFFISVKSTAVDNSKLTQNSSFVLGKAVIIVLTGSTHIMVMHSHVNV